LGLLALLVAPLTGLAAEHPILPLGSAAPDFSLPGVDGKIHKLSDYASSKVLVVVFTCDHCPNSQMYEGRVTQLYNDYKDKGVAMVAISPNDPKAIRIDELDSSDVSDTLDEMKIRVAYKHLQYPYLYDGDTEAVSQAYGPQASPHIFIFDQQRKLRYEGAIDDSYRIEFVKRHYAVDAINALLADQEVAVKHTGAFGCTTKWSDKEAANVAFMEKLNAQTISLDTVSADALKALHTNADGNVRLIQFWSTRCSECLKESFGCVRPRAALLGLRPLVGAVTTKVHWARLRSSVGPFTLPTWEPGVRRCGSGRAAPRRSRFPTWWGLPCQQRGNSRGTPAW